MNKLVMLALFKNEGECLEEWIEHYISEGVDHFYLVDNNSTDNYREVLKKYESIITLTSYDKYDQYVIYNNIYNNYIINNEDIEWIIICDIDEFFYASKNTETIKSYLNSLPKNIGQLTVRWLLFGSSNRIIDTPKSVISGYKLRKKYPTELFKEPKSIVKRTAVKELCRPNSHEHTIKKEYNTIKLNYNSENEILDSPVRINHYVIKSFDYFFNVKLKRNRPDMPIDLDENINYFKRHDTNEIYDDKLEQKKKYLLCKSNIKYLEEFSKYCTYYTSETSGEMHYTLYN